MSTDDLTVELLAMATEFTIPAPPLTAFDKDRSIRVVWRNVDQWAVSRHDEVWNGEEWEYEPSPSNRDDDFIARTRFTRDQAIWHAMRLWEDQQ